MATVVLDGCELHSREDIYREIRRQLALPGGFGDNADALYDALTSLARETRIVVACPGAARRNVGPYFSIIETVLADAAAVTPALTVEFVPDEAE